MQPFQGIQLQHNDLFKHSLSCLVYFFIICLDVIHESSNNGLTVLGNVQADNKELNYPKELICSYWINHHCGTDSLSEEKTWTINNDAAPFVSAS